MWNAIKSLVFEEVPDKSVPVVPQKEAPKLEEHMDIHVAPSNGVVDPVVKEKLQAAVLQSTPKSWTELHEQISTLKSVLQDEGAAYRAAIALLVKKGVSLDQLLLDASTCIDVLESKKQDFDKELELQVQNRVASRQKSVEELDQKIKALQEEISNLLQKRGEESTSIVAERQKIASTQDKFGAAYNALHQELVEEKNKIAIHGKV